MSTSAIPAPGVNIIIEGLIVLFFKRNGNQTAACQMAAVKDAPGHVFSLVIEKNGGNINPGHIPDTADLRLDVQNIPTGISFKLPNEQIDRLTGSGNPESFNWVLDFEGPDLYKKRIGADRSKLGPFLRIEHGEISTKMVSTNHFLCRRAAQPQWTLVGKVATRIGVRIALDQSGSTAVFVNGGSPVEDTRIGPGEQLDIVMKMFHPEDEAKETPHPDDANHYHRAIGQLLGEPEKLIFTSIPPSFYKDLPLRISPEASCLIGGMGTTEP